MTTQVSEPPAALPDYIASATPNPLSNRAPWYKNTAPTYAGIFLWFAFWDQMSAHGLAMGGLGTALLGIVLAGVVCYLLFYLVPGLLGLKTGLPLYVVGTSTFGALGGLIMPGFLMGLLQFGWLGVNTYYSADALARGLHQPGLFYPICIVWALVAALVGLKGIQYVAKVATFLPLIPLVVLLIGLVKFGPSADYYRPPGDVSTGGALMGVLVIAGYIVGFFATAGAAGVDFGLNSRDESDVRKGGVVGIIVAIIFTAGISVITIAGAQALGVVSANTTTMTAALGLTLNQNLYAAIMIGLALAAFPGACFSSFIAANSFKTVMPKVNPFLSVGIGALVSMLLAITKVAGDLQSVFGIIGASFGPICGAMAVDYLLAGRKWSGPRAGVNPAGWIAWAVGFFVGIMPQLHERIAAIPDVPAAPIAAFIVGAVLYYLCAKLGLLTPVVPMPQKAEA